MWRDEFFAIAASSKPLAAAAGGIAAALCLRRGPAPVDEAPPEILVLFIFQAVLPVVEAGGLP